MTLAQLNIPFGFLAVFAGMFGAIVGSFLNVVIHRLPAMQAREWEAEVHAELKRLDLPAPDEVAPVETLVWPGSRCPHCKAPIRWWHNVPLLSYAALGGRCASCREAISWRYPLVEAMTALLFLGLVMAEGVGLHTLMLAIFVATLVAIFWIDLDTTYIFDVLTLPVLWLGLIYRGVIQGQAEMSIVAAAAGYLFFWSISVGASWALKAFPGLKRRLGIADEVTEGMGLGDAKLAAMIGAWLGPIGLLVGVFFGTVLGSVFGVILKVREGESRPFPFGPALVAGALVSLFAGPAIWRWYYGLLV